MQRIVHFAFYFIIVLIIEVDLVWLDEILPGYSSISIYILLRYNI